MKNQYQQPQLSEKQIDQFMRQALQQAQLAFKMEEVPVGCIFVDRALNVVARSHNLTNTLKNASRHCQINCIKQMTAKQIKPSQTILFVTVQPCIMCAYALNLVNVQKVYFGQYNTRFGGCGSVLNAYNHKYVGGIMEKQSLDILKSFYDRGNQRIPEQMRNASRKKQKKE